MRIVFGLMTAGMIAKTDKILAQMGNYNIDWNEAYGG